MTLPPASADAGNHMHGENHAGAVVTNVAGWVAALISFVAGAMPILQVVALLLAATASAYTIRHFRNEHKARKREVD
jgi:hypothetical protein